MDTILTSPEFQQAIANILLLVVTGVVGAIAKAGYSWLKSNTTANQFALLQEIAAAAVKAAEQGAIGGFVTDRKATATNIVNEGLAKAGIKGLSAEQIEAAIEAAVISNASDFALAAQDRAAVAPVVREADEPVAPEVDTDIPDGTDAV